MIFEFDRIRVGTRLNRVASSRGVRGFREILFLLMLTGCAETGSDVAHLGPSELAEEVHAALAEPIRLDGYARLMPALQQLGPENVDAVSEVYTELFRGLGEPELRPFLDAWVAFDPAAALAYAERQPVALATKQAYAAVIYSWATREPIRAREVALEIIGESAYLTEAVTHALIRGWAMSDQDGLVKYVASSSDDPGYMAHIVCHMWRLLPLDRSPNSVTYTVCKFGLVDNGNNRFCRCDFLDLLRRLSSDLATKAVFV